MKSISTLSKSRFVNSPSQKTQISPPTKTNLSNSLFQVHNHPSTPRIPPIQHTFTATRQAPQHPPIPTCKQSNHLIHSQIPQNPNQIQQNNTEFPPNTQFFKEPRTQNQKKKKKKIKQTNKHTHNPKTQPHIKKIHKVAIFNQFKWRESENLLYSVQKPTERERSKAKKKQKQKKKTLNFWSSFENLRESKRVNLISMHLFFSLSLTLCEKKLEQYYTRLRSFFYCFLERERKERQRQRDRVKVFVCVTTLRHQKCGTYFG